LPRNTNGDRRPENRGAARYVAIALIRPAGQMGSDPFSIRSTMDPDITGDPS
jgi:hypothetical protein